MTVDEFARRLMALSDVFVAVAGIAFALASALVVLIARRLVRRPRVSDFEIMLPAAAAPAGELLFAHLHALLPRETFGLATVPLAVAARSSAGCVRLILRVEERRAGRLAATVATVWPGAALVATPSHKPLVALEWEARGAGLPRVRPLTGADLAIVRALARADTGEHLAYEVVIAPAVPRTHRRVWDLRPVHMERSATRTPSRVAGADRGYGGIAFDCRVVIAASASTVGRAKSLVAEIEPSVRVLAAGGGVRLVRPRTWAAALRPQITDDDGMLGPDELAALFPIGSLAAAATAAAQHESNGERLLGVRVIGTTKQEVRLSVAASRHHLHVLGPTGTGKSTLLLNLVTQDILAGRGCAVLDPKGDLVRDLLQRIPRGRMADVLYIGPEEGSRAVGINPLALGLDEDPHLAAENVLAIFKRIYEDNWGPRTDDVLKACLLTLVAAPGTTLAHIPSLLGDAALRRRLTASLDDTIGVGSFWRWYERISEARRLEVTAPLQNKLRDFLVRPRLRHLLCQPRSSADLRSHMERGGILLADLGTGRWGETASSLAGSFLVARLWQAALSRQAQREDARCDFLMYVDEFQSFLGIGGPFADALAQARGLRLSLTLANQHLGQLSREIRDAVATNARNRVVFRCAAAEASAVAPDLTPVDAETLTRLEPFEAVVRLSSSSGAVRFRTGPPTPPTTDAASAEEVIASSGARFGRDVVFIDKTLRELVGPVETPTETLREATSS